MLYSMFITCALSEQINDDDDDLGIKMTDVEVFDHSFSRIHRIQKGILDLVKHKGILRLYTNVNVGKDTSGTQKLHTTGR